MNDERFKVIVESVTVFIVVAMVVGFFTYLVHALIITGNLHP